jgi:hypothetical protein
MLKGLLSPLWPVCKVRTIAATISTCSFLLIFSICLPVFGEGLDRELVDKFFTSLQETANQGYADHQVMLAKLYEANSVGSKLGFVPDERTAVHWLKLAAEQGYCDAYYWLGLHYQKGKGVPRDYVLAYKWLNLATADGADPIHLDVLDDEMTKAQIAEGQKLSRDWQPT